MRKKNKSENLNPSEIREILRLAEKSGVEIEATVYLKSRRRGSKRRDRRVVGRFRIDPASKEITLLEANMIRLLTNITLVRLLFRLRRVLRIADGEGKGFRLKFSPRNLKQIFSRS